MHCPASLWPDDQAASSVSIREALRAEWKNAAMKIVVKRSTMVGAGALSMKNDR
jgi:hypothetical protein